MNTHTTAVDMSVDPAIQERALIAAGLRSRDPNLLEDLVRQHHPRIFRYLLGMTGSQDRAEDLTQETWVRVIERGSQYSGDSAFESWLLVVARNLAIDTARKAKFSLGAPRAQIADRHPWPASRMPSPLEVACRRETAGRVRAAVRALSPRLRSVWRLRFDDSLSLLAIARRLNLAPGTVRSRLHRSIAAIRAMVEPAGRNCDARVRSRHPRQRVPCVGREVAPSKQRGTASPGRLLRSCLENDAASC